jgi:hypothetical protein
VFDFDCIHDDSIKLICHQVEKEMHLTHLKFNKGETPAVLDFTDKFNQE